MGANPLKSYPALDPQFDPSSFQEKQFWHNVSDPRSAFVPSLADLMLHAIDAATLSSSPSATFENGRRGGPFGVAAAIPWQMEIAGNSISFQDWFLSLNKPEQTPFDAGSVREWRVIARAGNLVEVEQDFTAHAEMVCARYLGRACGGRNLWKRFVVIASSGAPCSMCTEAYASWGIPRIFLAGAEIATALSVGFHEGQQAVGLQIPWAVRFRSQGIAVHEGVHAEMVKAKLYDPYMSSGGLIYNSGPGDQSG